MIICPYCHKRTLIWDGEYDIHWDADDDNLGYLREYYHCTNEKCEGTRGLSLWYKIHTMIHEDVSAEDYKGRKIGSIKMEDVLSSEDNWILEVERRKGEKIKCKKKR